MLKTIKANIPNTITCLSLVSGCMAVVAAFGYNETEAGLAGYQWAWLFIGLAALFDFCDGAAARLLHAYSDLGKQLDSLSDLVSFGVAPGMLVYNTMTTYGDCHLLAFAAIAIPLFGEIRLARFNVDDRQTTSFLGLPIPANAIFWIGATAAIHSYSIYPGDWIMAGMILIVSSLMVITRLRMFSLKFKNFKLRENLSRFIIIAATVAFVAVFGLAGLAPTILLYVVMSLATMR